MKYNTGKREQILKFLSKNSSLSFTIEQISSIITPDGRGKSTVYRIVSELVESKELKRLSDEKTRHCTYQYIGNNECLSHLHLKCRDCGKLIHLDESISYEFSKALLSHGGFAIEDGGMIFGKCSDCNITAEEIYDEHACHHGHTHAHNSKN